MKKNLLGKQYKLGLEKSQKSLETSKVANKKNIQDPIDLMTDVS